jgi:hypothetical protein
VGAARRLLDGLAQAHVELWREYLEAARRDYARVARAIAGFEPLTMIADPAHAAEARRTVWSVGQYRHDADRRLVAARFGPDGSSFIGRPACGRGIYVQRLGRQVPSA